VPTTPPPHRCSGPHVAPHGNFQLSIDKFPSPQSAKGDPDSIRNRKRVWLNQEHGVSLAPVDSHVSISSSSEMLTESKECKKDPEASQLQGWASSLEDSFSAEGPPATRWREDILPTSYYSNQPGISSPTPPPLQRIQLLYQQSSVIEGVFVSRVLFTLSG
jgi:hypothetical protein